MRLHSRKLPLAGHRVDGNVGRVNKLCIFVGTTVLGYAGWSLGGLLGFEFLGCFLVSGVGSIAGVWLGWRVAQHFQ